MNNQIYTIILSLITISMIGIIGMQCYWLLNQFEEKKEALYRDSRSAIKDVDNYLRKELNSRASIDAEEIDKIDLYYESPDSTFEFIIQGTTRAKNYDGTEHRMDENLWNERIQQFQDIINEMAGEEIPKPSRLAERFLILYGQTDLDINSEKVWSKLAIHFDLDSIIQYYLSGRNIETDFQYGIRNNEEKEWKYYSVNADTNILATTIIAPAFYDDELTLHLELVQPNELLLKNMSRSLLLSGLMVLTILGSLFFMLSVILRQKQISQIKNDFINNMTHEFKTPLATIAFATANIENPTFIKSEEKIRSFTKIIRAENERMNAQVEQVLKAAIADKKAFTLQYETIDIHEVLLELKENTSFRINRNSHQLLSQLEATNFKIKGDILHINHMLSNLIDNALKYSPDGGNITIETKSVKDQIKISITDNGIGMNQSTQKKIFDQFYRVPTGNIHNIKGFGLGLSYAKAIAEQHGGKLTVESILGQGSAFTISLPATD